MGRIDEYPVIEEFREKDVLLVDGPRGTASIPSEKIVSDITKYPEIESFQVVQDLDVLLVDGPEGKRSIPLNKLRSIFETYMGEEDGKAGLVPGPKLEDAGKFLSAEGVWAEAITEEKLEEKHYVNEETFDEEVPTELKADMDEESFIMSFELLNKNSEVLSKSEIDLPLESTVVDIDYNKEEGTIQLVLTNGNKTEPIKISDITNGLVTQTSFDAAVEDLNTRMDNMDIPDVSGLVTQKYFDEIVSVLNSSIDSTNKQLTKDKVTFNLDYQDDQWGWNEDPERGADTFHPFKSGGGELILASDFSTAGSTSCTFDKLPEHVYVFTSTVTSAYYIYIWRYDTKTKKTYLATSAGPMEKQWYDYTGSSPFTVNGNTITYTKQNSSYSTQIMCCI